MNDASNLGMNKTGRDMSPIQSKEMEEGGAGVLRDLTLGAERLAAERALYIADADPVGSVPMPGTLRGAASTLMQKLKGEKPGVLIDKLGERLAFERTGARLYELLLTKCEVRPDEVSGVDLEQLKRIYEEEIQHFEMLVEVTEALGADPTAQTPSADVSGVMSLGLLQVLSDPRTSVVQSLQAILVAEHSDTEGWESLHRLVQEAGMEDIAARFQRALEEEERHVQEIRSMHQFLLLADRQAS